MRLTRWLNPMLPQTLQIATMLFYINAVFGVIYGIAFTPLGLVLTVGELFSGLGIANSYKWGYKLGVVISALALIPFVLIVLADGLGSILDLAVLLNLIFPLALFALVIHPQSRDYQKIWFE